MKVPPINGLLSYHIQGDDALLQLAYERYNRAGIGAEIHPGSPEHLAKILQFTPSGGSSSVHLPYDMVLYDDNTDVLRDFVTVGGEEIATYVLHDVRGYEQDLQRGVELIKKLSTMLANKSEARVCVEYAVGLSFDLFKELLLRIKDLPNIGICVDVGHIVINAVRDDFRKKFPDVKVCSIKPSNSLTVDMYREIEESCSRGRKLALGYIKELCSTGAYVHFHLHDGHPLSTFSPYLVCDHLPFFWEIPTGLSEIGSINGIYGVSGLQEILSIAANNLTKNMASFTLEIHPQAGMTELDENDAEYFSQWSDLTNAKRMNYWLDLVIQNSLLVKDIWKNLVLC